MKKRSQEKISSAVSLVLPSKTLEYSDEDDDIMMRLLDHCKNTSQTRKKGREEEKGEEGEQKKEGEQKEEEKNK